MEHKTHTIDATGKVLGRLATEVAVLLRGKNNPGFLLYKDAGDDVIIKNVEKIIITGKKMDQKKYYHHSGYPGGLKEVSMKKIFEKNPSEILKKAVLGMLPKNRLRPRQIKRLKFE
ncbi:MAG: 50S ribosomal protein L13 [bacterium]|nr:50S ribosomal protein L13 [bacterium]